MYCKRTIRSLSFPRFHMNNWNQFKLFTIIMLIIIASGKSFSDFYLTCNFYCRIMILTMIQCFIRITQYSILQRGLYIQFCKNLKNKQWKIYFLNPSFTIITLFLLCKLLAWVYEWPGVHGESDGLLRWQIFWEVLFLLGFG